MTRPSYSPPGHPIGYVELQTSWVGDLPFEKHGELLAELIRRGAIEHPGMVIDSTRLEQVADGAGVVHHNIYLGLRPKQASSEPLDPHNMNDAPPPQVGMPDPTDGIAPLGGRETKF